MAEWGGCSPPYGCLRTQAEGNVAFFIAMAPQITLGVASTQQKGSEGAQRIVREICLRLAYIIYTCVPLMRIQPADHDCGRKLAVLFLAG